MPHRSRAVVAHAPGGPEVLRVVEVDVPDPGPDEVLVAVHAAGVGHGDLDAYRPGTAAPGPVRPGAEVAGVVRAVGSAVRWFSPGDEVVAWPVDGGYADLVVAPERVLVRRPPGLSAPAGAGLLAAGAAALHAVDVTGVGAHDVVLVHGGSGGVGRMAAQLCALRGARVVTTVSPRHVACLDRYGAVPVASGPGLLERVRAAVGPDDRVDVAIDTTGTVEALDVSVALVADRTRVVTLPASARAAALGVRALGPGAGRGAGLQEAARAHLSALAADGALDVHVAATFPLADVADAHRLQATRRAGGKVVLLTGR
ncbi:quinone oxidoreductase family protein [Cellulomonas oligotrophica]|uniref:NADPH:quinone reductase-like Zn-dependent oxidoreductase n=1 Tax=Cellulomonas oligotrophica TaxID=931536 RepID=A0A7Y9JYU5_9CELL|nr:NADP-dependent oxidoreductase [Cellulomonas oligotrophica]NYD87167.1 NADPH:quinone reductase-like Zn-dependent oxidoreductase [Cellulomonas oligotrophica]